MSLSASGLTEAENKLRFTTSDSVFPDSGFVEVIREAYKRIGISISVVPIPHKRAAYENSVGKSDGELLRVASFNHDKPYLIRISVPATYVEIQAFTTNLTSDINMQNLCEYNIVVLRGGKLANELVSQCDHVEQVANAEQLIKLVRHKRADIGVITKNLGLEAIKQLGISDVYPSEQPIVTTPLYNFLHEKHKHLVPEIEAVLKEMTKSGELYKIKGKH